VGWRHVARLSASLLAFATTGIATPARSTTPSHYGVTISRHTTQNMAFLNGVYSATADNAYLNITDLKSALAAGSVEVTTGNGAGGDKMGDLHIEAGFTWSSGHALTLDAYHSIFVDRAVVNAGPGALTLTNNDGGTGGTFVYGTSGSVTIWSLTNALTIDGHAFTLVGDVHTLASDIAANPSGAYALANSYDASKDGTYGSAPIPTTFTGAFEGLGNVISNLTISDSTDVAAGLFASLGVNGAISDIGVTNANVTLTPSSGGGGAGALVAGIQGGTVSGAYSSGSIAGTGSLGGLVGFESGGNGATQILRSHSTATVSATGSNAYVGGLVGGTELAVIANSYATGSVIAGTDALGGGLVGDLEDSVVQYCFATGSVTIGPEVNNIAAAGGLIGWSYASARFGGSVVSSYAEGAVTGGDYAVVGGFMGLAWRDNRKGGGGMYSGSYSTGKPTGGEADGGFVGARIDVHDMVDEYWDTTTSGKAKAVGQGRARGITGVTTAQLQTAFGSDPTVWAENPDINDGLPYLVSNPPPQ